MPRYDRSYDYGLRGYRETTAFRPRGRVLGSASGYDRDYPLPNRITARYNADYVFGNRGDRYPTNHHTFGGDREQRVGDMRYYRQPYTTIGGTRTFRGSRDPMGYGRDFDTYDREFQGGW
jgi:hypothetical protein